MNVSLAEAVIEIMIERLTKLLKLDSCQIGIVREAMRDSFFAAYGELP